MCFFVAGQGILHLVKVRKTWGFCRSLNQIQPPIHYTTLHCTTLHYTTLNYATLQLQLQMQLHLHYTNHTTPQMQLHYATTTTTAPVNHTTSSSFEWGDHCNRCNQSKKHNSNHLSVHQWIHSAIHVLYVSFSETSATALCGTTSSYAKITLFDR